MNINLSLLLASAFVLFIFYGMPIALAAFTDRVSGNRKLGWIILTVFFSWIGYALMLILGPMIEREARSDDRT